MAREQKVRSKASQAGKDAKANERAVATPPTPAQKSVEVPSRVQWPSWPTSKPGPQTTPPPPGMRPINAMRSEQVTEVGYNQETGQPGVQEPIGRSLPDESKTGSVSFDQQDPRHKQKKRL